MASTIYLKDMDATYWKVQSSNLVQTRYVGYLTRFFVLNPTTVSVLGGNKNTIFTPTVVRANFQQDMTPPTMTLLRENEYQTINWLTYGWTANNRAVFLQEVKTWVLNNLDNGNTNPFPATSGFTVHFCTGTIQPTGFSYNLVLVGYGNLGPVL